MNGDQGTAIKVHAFEHFALIRPTRCAVCQAFIVRTCHTIPRVLLAFPIPCADALLSLVGASSPGPLFAASPRASLVVLALHLLRINPNDNTRCM